MTHETCHLLTELLGHGKVFVGVILDVYPAVFGIDKKTMEKSLLDHGFEIDYDWRNAKQPIKFTVSFGSNKINWTK